MSGQIERGPEEKLKEETRQSHTTWLPGQLHAIRPVPSRERQTSWPRKKDTAIKPLRPDQHSTRPFHEVFTRGESRAGTFAHSLRSKQRAPAHARSKSTARSASIYQEHREHHPPRPDRPQTHQRAPRQARQDSSPSKTSVSRNSSSPRPRSSVRDDPLKRMLEEAPTSATATRRAAQGPQGQHRRAAPTQVHAQQGGRGRVEPRIGRPVRQAPRASASPRASQPRSSRRS